MFEQLKRSRQFWIAVVAALWNVLFYVWPDFPPEVRDALNVLAMVIIGALTVEDAARAVANARAPVSVAAINYGNPEQISWLFKSRKFWFAVFAAVQSIVFASIPDFPPEIWQSIDAIVVVAILSLTVADSTAHIAASIRYKK